MHLACGTAVGFAEGVFQLRFEDHFLTLSSRRVATNISGRAGANFTSYSQTEGEAYPNFVKQAFVGYLSVSFLCICRPILTMKLSYCTSPLWES